VSETLLKDLCLKGYCGIYGIPAIAEEYDEKKTRYLRITDVSEDGCLLNADLKSVSSENIEKYILNEGDIVFARTGNSTGKTYYHEKKNGQLAFAGFLIKYSLDPKKLNPKYLRYFTISNEYRTWVTNLSLGSTRGNINAQTFSNLPLTLPTRVQQDTLVKILSALDAKIELNNRINVELEAMAKTLYDYWFVQFDFPISKEQAKTMGKPGVTGKPYKSSGGRMVYNKTLKKEIPECWEVYSLSKLLRYNYSSIGKQDSYKIINYLDTSSLTKNFLEKTQQFNVEKDKVPSRAKRIVSKNDILYSTVRPNQFHYGIIKHPIKNLIASTGFVQLNSKKDWVSNDLIYTFLTSSWVTERLQQIAELSVSSYPSISPNDILDLQIALPKQEKDLDFINLKFDMIYNMASTNHSENQQLTQLRDWLLPMLMNGQVTVK